MDRRAKFEAAALALRATYDWSIIPIRNDGQGRKRAACKWEQYQRRRASAEEIKRLFSRRGITGLAVILGQVSHGLYGRDFDELEAYRRWAAQYPDLARVLPTAESVRGRHVYAYHVGAVRKIDLGDGELRGEEHYIVLPPSLHPTGKQYVWITPPRSPCPQITIAPDEAGLSRPWIPLHQTKEETEGTEFTEGTEVSEVSDGFRGIGCGGGEHLLTGETGLTDSDLIRLALPSDVHQNHTKVFLLARGVKAFEEREGREWSEAEMRERAFLPWYTQNNCLRPDQTRDEYWFEFLQAYDDAKCPLGQGVLERTWRLSGSCEPPTVATQFEDPRLRRLVAWCRELQRAAGSEPFFLATRTVAAKLGLPTSWRGAAFLRGLVRTGILDEVEKGGPKTNKATRFRYLHPV